MTRRVALALAALGVCSPASGSDSGAQQPLKFCLAAHNLPLSTSHPPWGIDGEIAKQIGSNLAREVQYVWISEEEETPEEALRQGRCDAAMGAVIEADTLARGGSAPGLALTVPYYTAGYMLIHQSTRSAPAKLEDIGDARIGVEMVSIPIYTLKQNGRSVYALADTEAVVRAVAQGRAEYGYVWGPVAAWLLRDRNDVVLAEGFEPREKWSFALAVREKDEKLRKELNDALLTLVGTGGAQRTFARFGVPYMPPAGQLTCGRVEGESVPCHVPDDPALGGRMPDRR